MEERPILSVMSATFQLIVSVVPPQTVLPVGLVIAPGLMTGAVLSIVIDAIVLPVLPPEVLLATSWTCRTPFVRAHPYHPTKEYVAIPPTYVQFVPDTGEAHGTSVCPAFPVKAEISAQTWDMSVLLTFVLTAYESPLFPYEVDEDVVSVIFALLKPGTLVFAWKVSQLERDPTFPIRSVACNLQQ